MTSRYGSSRFCAIHCGTVCGCCISGSFAPNIFFQNGGDVSRLATCGAGRWLRRRFRTWRRALPQRRFCATQTSYPMRHCLRLSSPIASATSSASPALYRPTCSCLLPVCAAAADLLDNAFGMCSEGQLTFFLGVLSIQWLSSDCRRRHLRFVRDRPSDGGRRSRRWQSSRRRRQRGLDPRLEVAQP